MNIESILYALEVHNSGSISRAAQNLYVAQPNLSNTIKELEKELGITIFIRSKNGVTTTEEGLEFIQYARSVATRYEALVNHYGNSDTDSVITISSMRSSVFTRRILNYVNGLLANGKTVNVKFRETSNENVIQDVMNNQADIGIIRANLENAPYFKELCETNQFVMLPLPTECYILLMSNTHPLANETNITEEMLKSYVEVVYGDVEKSWYPNLSGIHGRTGASSRPNLFYVYDRATFFDAVSNINGAFSITTTAAHDQLAKYDLIEKGYPGRIMESSEYILLKESSLHSDKISPLLSALCINT